MAIGKPSPRALTDLDASRSPATDNLGLSIHRSAGDVVTGRVQPLMASLHIRSLDPADRPQHAEVAVTRTAAPMVDRLDRTQRRRVIRSLRRVARGRLDGHGFCSRPHRLRYVRIDDLTLVFATDRVWTYEPDDGSRLFRDRGQRVVLYSLARDRA